MWAFAAVLAALPMAMAQQSVWGQCGGIGWGGATTCAGGTTCIQVNSYYYQCQPASSTTSTTVKASSTISATTTTTTTTSPILSTSQSSQLPPTSKSLSTTTSSSTSSKPSTTPSPTPSPANLNACLVASGVPYDTQGSSDWNTDILPFNQRLPFTPAAIAVPTSIPHVQGAIACGTQFGYKINAKGGGHSYASHSLGGENGHLVIELDRMYNVTLNSTTNVAVVQAGARLGHVLTQLDSQGKRAFSTGTCPGVGVSGHALHGGYGFSSRKYGLATDWIVGAQMVLANGTLIHVSATENPDIFWAIRGAGSNFGVIVSYEFNTFAQPSQVTYFTVTANWNANNMQANMLALENYTRYSMPAELTMRYSINPGGQNEFEGMYYGNKTGLQTALAPLFNNVSPKLSLGSSTTTTFMGAFDYYAYTPATDPTYPYNTQENFYAKSLVVNHLNGTAAQAFVNYIFTQGPSNTRQWWLQLDLHGGANSAVTNGDFSTSSYAHRDKIFLMQFYDRVYSGSYPSTGFSFLNGWVSSITNNLNASDWGMYINYADSTLDRATAQSAYYGASLPRLQALKAALDPSEVFYYPSGSLQAIAS